MNRKAGFDPVVDANTRLLILGSLPGDASLRAAGVGLWDVIASAERPGSLDAAIRAPEAADLRGLVGALPALRAVAFNGGKAAKLGRAVLADRSEGVALIDLPSSSPAHARPFEEKAAAWAALAHPLA